MEKKTKIWIAVGFFIAVVVSIIFAMRSECFDINPAINVNCKPCPAGQPQCVPECEDKKLMVSDLNSNISLFTTNKDSILYTDQNGKLKNLPFPKGIIMIWYNNSKLNPTNDDLPVGWFLCDGNNDTPDLRGRFVLGAGTSNDTGISSRTAGESKGEEAVAMSEANIPRHSHTGTMYEGGDNSFSGTGDRFYLYPAYMSESKSTGGWYVPHNNMPPYYVLCYIMYNPDIIISRTFVTTPGKKLVTVDTNPNSITKGDIVPYQINNNSVLLTNQTGIFKSLSFPRGLIMSCSRAVSFDTPGWSLCDGRTYNGYTTPDLRSRFVLSSGSGSGLTPRTVGYGLDGEEKHSLTLSEMPAHKHTAMQSILNIPNRDGGASDNTYRTDFGNSGSWGGNPNNNGLADPHENMPPYYVLYYICYTGINL